MKKYVLYFILLSILTINQKAWTQESIGFGIRDGELPCLPSHGGNDNVTAWCGEEIATQTIELTEGWNWVSLYIEFEDAEQALLAFEAALDGHGLKISSVDDFTTYADGEWGAMGDLEEMTNDLMYMVLVDEDIVVTLEGMPSNPSDYAITIYPGWTWIGFPSPVPIVVEDAFADFEPEDGDKIMGVEDYTTYVGEWGAAGDLDELVPGTGYMYFSNSTETKTLVFQTGTNTHAYVDLGLPSGTLWATCNVGANAPEEYGDYFAWGETQPKDNYKWSTYKYCNGDYLYMTKYCTQSGFGYNGFTDNLTTLLPEDDAATVNWGNGWRMPTQAEWQELYSNTTWTWTTQNGVNGRLFTASNGNSIFLPAAGSRDGTTIYYAGSIGNYWSRSLRSDHPCNARRFRFTSSANYVNDDQNRCIGHSVRAVRSGNK